MQQVVYCFFIWIFGSLLGLFSSSSVLNDTNEEKQFVDERARTFCLWIRAEFCNKSRTDQKLTKSREAETLRFVLSPTNKHTSQNICLVA